MSRETLKVWWPSNERSVSKEGFQKLRKTTSGEGHSFSPLKGRSRNDSTRRIKLARAIAGVFRAVDSVHCRNEKLSLVCGQSEAAVRPRRRGTAAIIARFIAPLRFVCLE